MTYAATLDDQLQLKLPAEVCEHLGWQAGTELEIEASGNVLIITRKPTPPTL